MIEARHGEPKT